MAAFSSAAHVSMHGGPVTPVHVFGGLCNRLRTILSWRAVHGPLIVAWEPNGEIANERFGDAFAPLAGVTFVDTPAPEWPKTLDVHPRAFGWEKEWFTLQRLPGVAPIVAPSAVHVRRTDNEVLQRMEGTWQPDDAFIAWCKSVPDPIYLATDNGTTQAGLAQAIKAMGKVWIAQEAIPARPTDTGNIGGLRNTGLRTAWADLLSCVYAQHFKGSGSSSFTTTIETMRRLRA